MWTDDEPLDVLPSETNDFGTEDRRYGLSFSLTLNHNDILRKPSSSCQLSVYRVCENEEELLGTTNAIRTSHGHTVHFSSKITVMHRPDTEQTIKFLVEPVTKLVGSSYRHGNSTEVSDAVISMTNLLAQPSGLVLTLQPSGSVLKIHYHEVPLQDQTVQLQFSASSISSTPYFSVSLIFILLNL